jgi:hypothetical protein
MRAQQPFTGLGISFKVIGLAVIFFVLKYVLMGVIVLATLFSICYFVRQIFNNK